MTYKYYYEGHGQTETHDDVLNQRSTWENGKNGQVKKGGKFGPGGSFPNGSIFTGTSFTNFIKFGKGCIFVNCTFNYNKKNPYSTFDTGCIFDNCTLNGVTIPKDAILNKCKIGVASVQSQYINNKGSAVPNKGTVQSTHPATVGNRLTNMDGDITGQPGIHGISKAKVTTDGTENLPPTL